jgi:hypothetical protein
MNSREIEQLSKVIGTLSELVARHEAISFERTSAAFEAQDAVDIFSMKRPSDFSIDWVTGREDVLFFLPEAIYFQFLPAFLLASAKELKEKQNITETENLFCILVRKNYSNQKQAADFLKKFGWCFDPLIDYSVKIGIIGEKEAETFRSIR